LHGASREMPGPKELISFGTHGHTASFLKSRTIALGVEIPCGFSYHHVGVVRGRLAERRIGTDALMDHLEVTQCFVMLVVMLGAAKLGGFLAKRVGQPAVLGELVGGVIVGQSGLALINTEYETIHMLSELGVFILLLAIGLETDIGMLLRVGPTSAAVVVPGMVLALGLGYLACRGLGLANLVAVMAWAALTATSVGITARVLAELGRLRDVEGQIILGAAILDDVLGLVILTMVTGLSRGQEVTLAGVSVVAGIAFGFLITVLLIGKFLLPWLTRITRTIDLPGTPSILALIMALALAWLADKAGSALVLGAFAAGLLLAGPPRVHEIEKGIMALGHFFVPLFFVSVGASVNLRVLNPMQPDEQSALIVGGVLVVVEVLASCLLVMPYTGSRATRPSSASV
jgi:Kef-type K+ transport system membrane component KefB